LKAGEYSYEAAGTPDAFHLVKAAFQRFQRDRLIPAVPWMFRESGMGYLFFVL
jgi:hypothetical protein